MSEDLELSLTSDGDKPGHVFRGNQYTKTNMESATAAVTARARGNSAIFWNDTRTAIPLHRKAAALYLEAANLSRETAKHAPTPELKRVHLDNAKWQEERAALHTQGADLLSKGKTIGHIKFFQYDGRPKSKVVTDGEAPGHPFRGNQYAHVGSMPSQAGWMSSPGGWTEEAAHKAFKNANDLINTTSTEAGLKRAEKLIKEAEAGYAKAIELYTAHGDVGPIGFLKKDMPVQVAEARARLEEARKELPQRANAKKGLDDTRELAVHKSKVADDYDAKANKEDSIGAHNRAMQLHEDAAAAWREVRTREMKIENTSIVRPATSGMINHHITVADTHRMRASTLEYQRHAEEIKGLPLTVGKKPLFLKPDMTDFQMTHIEAHNAVLRYGREAGINPSNVRLSTEPHNFVLKGRQCTAGGTVNTGSKDLGDMRITVYPQAMQGASRDQWIKLMSHESGHVVFEQAMRNYELDHHNIINDPNLPIWSRFSPEARSMRASGELVGGAQYDYPAYSHFLKTYDIQKLKDSDGVTQYSRDYWTDYAEGKSKLKSAVHETFAEIHSLKTHWDSTHDEHGFSFKDHGIKPVWEKFYKSVMTLAKKKKYAKDGDLPGHEFHGNQYTRGAVGHHGDGDRFFSPDALNEARHQSEKSRETLVHMDPQVFIKLALPGHDIEKEKGVMSLVDAGTKFSSVPMLYIDKQADGTWKVGGHEGRHRSRAMAIVGVTSMPVRVKARETEHGSLRWGENPNHPTTMRSEDGMWHVAFPASDLYNPRKIAHDGEGAGHPFRGNQYTHLPAEPGTTPVKEGYVRLYHQTSAENMESIAKTGIDFAHARGIEGPKGIYAGEQPFYGGMEGIHNRHTVEFQVPKEDWDGYLVRREVKPSDIIATHVPWHWHARYMESEPELLKNVVAGRHDSLMKDPAYAPAIAYIKRKYGHVTTDGEGAGHPFRGNKYVKVGAANQPPAEHHDIAKLIEQIIDSRGHEMGLDKSKVEIVRTSKHVQDESTGMGGHLMASISAKTGGIEVYTEAFVGRPKYMAQEIGHALAHEAMHEMTFKVLRQMKDEHKYGINGSARALVVKHFNEANLLTLGLHDGITQYSLDWWDKAKSDPSHILNAVSETLAEMHGVRHGYGKKLSKMHIDQSWLSLYNDIMKFNKRPVHDSLSLTVEAP